MLDSDNNVECLEKELKNIVDDIAIKYTASPNIIDYEKYLLALDEYNIVKRKTK